MARALLLNAPPIPLLRQVSIPVVFVFCFLFRFVSEVFQRVSVSGSLWASNNLSCFVHFNNKNEGFWRKGGTFVFAHLYSVLSSF